MFQSNGAKAGQHQPTFHVHVVPRYADSKGCTVIPVGESRSEGRRFVSTPALPHHRLAGLVFWYNGLRKSP